MKPKIIFIINSIQQQRCIKRIEEFIANGYEVEAYGFSRSEVIPTLPENFKIEVLAQFDNSVSYHKRLIIMYKALRPVFKRHQHEQVVYYYFLLDVALVCRMLSHKPYIYEESDLMQTYIPSALVRNTLNWLDKRIIRHSLITTMTSEGFAQFHYGTQYPANIVFVSNKLNNKVLQLSYTPSSYDMNHLRIGFVGGARYQTVVNFVRTFAEHFPQHEFHFYGTILDFQQEFEQIIETHANVYYHGKFSNPADLPAIYQNIDLVLATYDTQFENVRYAEPNKLYEAAYFQTPIIVSQNTFLAQRVQQLGIGWAVDAMSEKAIMELINGLSQDEMARYIANCAALDRQQLVNTNPLLFKKLDQVWNSSLS